MNAKPFSTILNSPDAKVIFEQHSSDIFEFKLNNNKTLNAVDFDMLSLLEQQLRVWNDGDAPRVAMISGTGGKAFCAGGDIVSLYNAKKGDGDPKILREFFHQEYKVDYNLSKMKPLQVSIWNGFVMGGGVGVSVHAPIRIATDNSVFAMPETGIGLFTDVGASYFLSRVKGNINLGLYLGLTGHRLKAKDLVKWGVATHFVPADKIQDMKEDLVKNVCKDSSDKYIESIIAQHQDITGCDEPIENLDKINEIFSDEGGFKQLFNRLHSDNSDFGSATRKQLKSMSPLSMGVTYEAIKRGKNINLRQAFEMEFKLAQGFMNHTEFFEGVRALLVEKDRNPKWKHNSIVDLQWSEVEEFFNRDDQIQLDL